MSDSAGEYTAICNHCGGRVFFRMKHDRVGTDPTPGHAECPPGSGGSKQEPSVGSKWRQYWNDDMDHAYRMIGIPKTRVSR